MRRQTGALLTTVLSAALAAAAAPVPSPPSIEALVERLGEPGYREREQAAKDLLGRGAAALPALEVAAAAHADAEVRWRAAALAEKLRRTADAARLVAAPRVRLEYDRVPLASAVADLRKKTGIPLVLDDRAVADPSRPVTVRTGDVPAWEAVDLFCRAAGLTELFREELGAGGPAESEMLRRRRLAYSVPSLPAPESAGQVPVVLADGKAAPPPGDRSTAVRVLALPPAFPGHRVVRGAGEVVLNLDVTPLPGVRWDDVTTVRVHRAEDETGRPVTTSYRPEPPGDLHQFENGIFLGGPGQVVVWGGMDSGMWPPVPGARPNPRIVPVPLKTDDRAIRTLRVFEGAVIGEVTVPNQPLLAVENLARAAGAVVYGPGDLRVSVLSYQQPPGGDLVVKVRFDGPNPWTLQRLGRRALFFGGGMAWETTYARPVAGPQHHFFDAAGTRLTPTQTRTVASTDDGVRQTNDLEFVFRRPAKAAPERLVVVGDKPAVVEIPFKLRNVPLP